MPESVFDRVVVPVANPDDAEVTAQSLAHYLDGDSSTVIGIFVLEKAGGSLDKASVEQREAYAEEVFAVFEREIGDTGVSIETRIQYGTDIAESIMEAAHDRDATAIVFTPRGGSRWKKILSGDVTHKLVSNSDVPIIVTPPPNRAHD